MSKNWLRLQRHLGPISFKERNICETFNARCTFPVHLLAYITKGNTYKLSVKPALSRNLNMALCFILQIQKPDIKSLHDDSGNNFQMTFPKGYLSIQLKYLICLFKYTTPTTTCSCIEQITIPNLCCAAVLWVYICARCVYMRCTQLFSKLQPIFQCSSHFIKISRVTQQLDTQ